MAEIWHASMQGVPWTVEKMSAAVKQLRNRATISFVIGVDRTEDLVELDKRVFAKRPDLILYIWNRDAKTPCPEELLKTIAAMQYVAALKLDLQQPHDLTMLSAMKQMQFLNVVSPKKAQSLAFIHHYKQLTYLELHGKFDDLAPIAACKQLNTLVLNCTIEQLDFIVDLPLLQYLSIDSCDVKGPLEVIAHSSVTMLSLSSIRNLRDIQAVGEMYNLEFLSLVLTKVEQLCNFSKLDKLRQLELSSMKTLRDVDNLWSAKRLEYLELKELNTAIKAAAFAPLAKMPHLRQVDFRFIDFNKGRIAAMKAQLEQAGKGHLIYENISENQLIRSIALEHLAPILT
ncbi:hypothetical protein ACFSTH_01095 [Paenibacillus yanchengensis]|uniref:Leucine-rich repeat domain-containing protein n=1 Tax=Paenibacillus yanchengensis TaxID=2035833 RepID=A0ABW4YFA2_9BACL